MLETFFLKRHRSAAKRGAQEFLQKPIRSLMTKYVVTVKPSTTVIQAATRMVAQDISCLIVVAEENNERPVGIVTERDFLKKVPATTSALKKKVQDIMTDKVVTVSPDITVKDAFEIMRAHGFRKLVVAENSRLLGVMTQTDIVAHARASFRYFAASQPCVSNWMTKTVITASKSASFADVKKKMVQKNIGAIMIKGKDYEGIFTEYDVVAQFYDQGGMLKISSPKEIMHPHIRSIASDASLMKANRIMLEKKVRRLLVIDGTTVLGIITQTDIAKAMVEAAKELVDDVFLKKQTDFETRSDLPINSCFVGEHFKLYD